MIPEEQQKQVELDFNSRKDRLLLVVSLFGALVFIFSKIHALLEPTFATIYINGFPFNTKHVLFTVLLASGIYILFYLLMYAYYEYTTLAQFDSVQEKIHCIRKAETWYKKSITAVKRSVIFSLATTSLSAILFDYQEIVMYILIGVLIGVSIILIGKLKPVYTLLQKYHLTGTKTKRLMTLSSKLFYTVITLLFLCSLVSTYSMQYLDIGGKLHVKYEASQKTTVELGFTDAFPDQLDFLVLHGKEEKITMHSSLKQEDFSLFFTEISSQEINERVENTENGAKREVQLNQNQYSFKKTLDVTHQLKDGDNYIIIQFTKKKWFGKQRDYKVLNQVVKDGKKVTFHTPSSKLEF